MDLLLRGRVMVEEWLARLWTASDEWLAPSLGGRGESLRPGEERLWKRPAYLVVGLQFASYGIATFTTERFVWRRIWWTTIPFLLGTPKRIELADRVADVDHGNLVRACVPVPCYRP